MTSLTIFKIKSGVTDHDEILRDRGALRSYPIRVGGVLLGILYARRTPLRSPRWRTFFEGFVDFDGLDLRTAAAAAVLLIQRPAGHVLAVAFGYGRWLIKEGAVEPRFGLKATLNAIDPESIQSIDHKRLEAISRLTREQLSRASNLQYFGLDVERDLLRAVTGRPRDATLGRRLAGADPLVVVGDLSLQGLGTALDRYTALGQGTTYRQDFGFVDFIAEVEDPVLHARLDEMLVARLRRRTPENAWLAPPEIIDWDDIEGFRYGARRHARVHEELSLADYFRDAAPRNELTIERLRDDRVRCASATGGQDKQQWSVYRCLIAEITLNRDIYALSEGKWYRVQQDFLAAIEAVIADLRPTNAPLPPCRQRSESRYNQRAYEQGAGRFALLDRQLVASIGRGHVEVCDLYSRDRQLIHVKRYSGSGTLSHLFNQGVVSAELLQNDRTFRQAFDDLLPATHRLTNPAAAILPADYEVAYAIITPRGRDLRLPFFSKVTLRNAARLLQHLGYRVTITGIPSQ